MARPKGSKNKARTVKASVDYAAVVAEKLSLIHIFQSDESGKLILGALHDAADRGVQIRLLVDGMESWIDMEGNP